METKYYEFDQNNTGGSFTSDDVLCHRLIIEADTAEEANDKAEQLGCYWDGVYDGMDCNCCGDRWYPTSREIDFVKFSEEGWQVSIYDHYENPEELWKKKYGSYEIVEVPTWRDSYGTRVFEGNIKFKDVEEYAQLMANEYGWTVPDIRIFYKDGTVKEIFNEAVAEEEEI